MSSENKTYSLEEIRKRNKPDDLWVVIHNKVYDLTKFRKEHPGGADVLDEVAGKNGTRQFDEAGHSKEAKKMMEKYYIGDLNENERNKSRCPGEHMGLLVGAVVLGLITAVLIKRFILTKSN